MDLRPSIHAAEDVARQFDAVIALDRKVASDCIARLEAYRERSTIIGVLPIDEYSVEPAAAIAEHLHIVGNTPASVALIRNKVSCREKLAEAGFHQPRARACSSLSEGMEFIRASDQGRFIVKPVSASGSLAVSEVGNEDQLRAGADAVAKAGFDAFVIEEYVTGDEYSVEGVFVDGRPWFLGITQKSILGNGSFVEVGHVTPAPIPPSAAFRMYDHVGRALRCVGLTRGLFHVELWSDGPRIVIGEIHARAGGDYIHLLTELTSGVETYGAFYDDLLDRSGDPSSWSSMTLTQRVAAAIEYMILPPGRIDVVTFAPDLLTDPHLVLMSEGLKVGATVPTLRWSRDRVGYVVATGADAADAKAQARRLAGMIHVEIAPA